MAETDKKSSTTSSDAPASYIVYTDKPEAGKEESHHLRTLSTVLGSDEAAKKALGHIYTTAATGFSATLTPAQAEEMKKQPGVIQVVKSQTVKLQTGTEATIGSMQAL